jgi:hypothetical protein
VVDELALLPCAMHAREARCHCSACDLPYLFRRLQWQGRAAPLRQQCRRQHGNIRHQRWWGTGSTTARQRAIHRRTPMSQMTEIFRAGTLWTPSFRLARRCRTPPLQVSAQSIATC